MADNKHTPGPWGILSETMRNRPRCLILDEQSYQIAEVNPYRQAWREDSRVIAAAPDLLRACELVELWMRGKQPQPFTDSQVLSVVSDAIATAKGG